MASDRLRTTETTLRIIERLKALNGARVAEIAEEMDLPTSTVHTHLKTLHQNGYLVKRADSYQLGGKFFHLGMYMRDSNDLYRLVKDNLHRFVDENHEQADFSIEDHGRLLILHNEYSIEKSDWLGTGVYHPMHQTAAGKAILAELPDDEVHRIVNEWGLPAETDRTTTDKQELLAELDEVREQNYAVNDGELVEGMTAVGAPVRNSMNEVFGAIAISGPSYRSEPAEMAQRIHPLIGDIEDEIDAKNLF
jgi:DNA-binding IclR family transcriptional regulator